MVKYKKSELDFVFSALGDPTRRAILERLRSGPASVTQLTEPFDMSFAAVSKHLSVLLQAGLVEAKKDGRVHWMHLRSKSLKDASGWLDHYESFWSERLDAFDRVLSSSKRKK